MQAELLDSMVSNSMQLFADKGFKVRVIMRCSDPWFVENNPMGWQARNRKFILGEWLNHHMTIPA